MGSFPLGENNKRIQNLEKRDFSFTQQKREISNLSLWQLCDGRTKCENGSLTKNRTHPAHHRSHLHI